MAVPEAVEPYPGTTLRRLVANISTNDTAHAGSAVTKRIVCQSPSYWGARRVISITLDSVFDRLLSAWAQSWRIAIVVRQLLSIGNVGIFDDGCYSQRNHLHCPAGAMRRQIAAGHGVHQNPPSPGRIPKGQEIPLTNRLQTATGATHRVLPSGTPCGISSLLSQSKISETL